MGYKKKKTFIKKRKEKKRRQSKLAFPFLTRPDYKLANSVMYNISN